MLKEGGMPKRATILVTVAVTILAAGATATDIAVPGDAATIAEALDLATAGDRILVATGTYAEHDLVLPAGVHLSGLGPRPESVVIDAQQHGRVFTVTGNATRIERVRLTGGVAVRGGGIRVDAGNLILDQVVIDHCEASSGGAVFVSGAEVVLDGCVLVDNEATTSGGALQVVASPSTQLTGCLLHGNRAGAMGGAWYAALSQLAITSTTIVGNVSALGGEGVAFGEHAVVATELVATDNDTPDGWQGLTSTLLSDATSRTQNTCTLRWQGQSPAWPGYLGDQLDDPSLGNIEADPLYCAGSGEWSDVYGVAAGSPALPDGQCGLKGAFGQACDEVVGVETPVAVDGLHAAYPNPFNPVTTIAFDVARAGPVKLRIYGLDGRRIATLVDDHAAAGHHEVTWRGQDHRGRRIASGVYLARLSTPTGHHAIRLTLVK
jgi:hypothetical protein